MPGHPLYHLCAITSHPGKLHRWKRPCDESDTKKLDTMVDMMVQIAPFDCFPDGVAWDFAQSDSSTTPYKQIGCITIFSSNIDTQNKGVATVGEPIRVSNRNELYPMLVHYDEGWYGAASFLHGIAFQFQSVLGCTLYWPWLGYSLQVMPQLFWIRTS